MNMIRVTMDFPVIGDLRRKYREEMGRGTGSFTFMPTEQEFQAWLFRELSAIFSHQRVLLKPGTLQIEYGDDNKSAHVTVSAFPPGDVVDGDNREQE